MTIENDDFEIEFDFDFFGQKEEDSVKKLLSYKKILQKISVISNSDSMRVKM